MKRAFKIFLLLFAFTCVAFLLLSRVEFNLPQSAVELVSEACSTGDAVFRIESISVRFPKKVRLGGVRMFIGGKPDAKPFLSARRIDVRLSPLKLPWKARDIVKSVTVSGARMPRLPDGYYIPDSIEFPGSYDFTETDEPLELDLPEFSPFRLTLLDADILDLKAEKVVAGKVSSEDGILRFADVRVLFPDRDARMEVTGECELNVPAQRVSGSVHGQARQPNIRPMLQALDITNCYQFIDAFTGVTTPVDAGCRFDVNLRNSDLNIFLDLHPTGGAYRDVPLETALGNVDVRVFVRGHCQNARITVGPIDARLADGTSMTGSVFYENTNDVGFVTFRNVRSTTSLSNALAIADVLNDGTLDCLQPETPPTLTLNGMMAVDPRYAYTNRLDGSMAFRRGTFFGIPLFDASTDFRLRGDSVHFDNAHSKTEHGGAIAGSGKIAFPGFDSDRASFGISIDGELIPFEDAATAFGMDSGDMRGKLSGHVEFEAPLSTALVSRINGKASVKVSDGQIARLKLFAGLTDYLAKTVPGISSLVDQSDAELECVISNGVIHATRVDVYGDVFKITGSGTYSIPDDALDFTARVRLFRNDSIMGRIANPITWTFSKLLLEFKVYGPLDAPEWKYISVVDRLL